MSSGKTVMIFGIGDLGGWILEFLARHEGVSTIVAVDKRDDYGVLKTHAAAAGAGHMGYSKTIKFESCDVFDIDRTAELLKKYNPDFIHAGLAQISSMSHRFVPPDVGQKIEMIDGGPLMCLQFPPIIALMKAVKESRITAPVLNNTFPDIVNPVLWRNGLGPLVGAGNIDSRVSEIRRKVSLAENLPIPEISVYLIAEHFGAPYFLKIMIGDKDITSKFDCDLLMADKFLFYPPAKWYRLISFPTAASCSVRTIMGILNDTHEFSHVPGPNGLIGGYPVRLSANGAEVALPEGITMEEAIKINTDGMKNEGVEEIKDDGTLVFTDEACKATKELLGISCTEFRFADMEDWFKELFPAFKKLLEKYNAPLSFF